MRPRKGGTPTWRSASPTSRSSLAAPEPMTAQSAPGRGNAAQRPRANAAPAPSGVRIWLMAARVRTLPASIAPVLVGTALVGYTGVFHPLRFVAALIGSLFIQVGTNL